MSLIGCWLSNKLHSSYATVGQRNLWFFKITLFLISLKDTSSFCLNGDIWSGCVPRTTRHVFFVGRVFSKRLSGTPGQIEGGSLGISFPLLLYGDVYGTAGQCLLHNTASLDEILNEIAFLNNANWSACLGSLKTGIFFRFSRGISLLKWFWLHPGTRHFFPWSNIVFNKISNFRLLFS